MTTSTTPTFSKRWFRLFCLCFILALLELCRIGQFQRNFYDTITIHPADGTTTTSTAFSYLSSLFSPPEQLPSYDEYESSVSQEVLMPEDSAGQPRILMVSYVFGQAAAQKRYLRLFVESARFSGVDVLILGDPVPPFFDSNRYKNTDSQLSFPPPNVRHLKVTWSELMDRLEANVFLNDDGTNSDVVDAMRKSEYYYKVIDYKPLFAVLFPEQVARYDWWGHLDNDQILGDIRSVLSSISAKRQSRKVSSDNHSRNITSDLLQDFDIISGISKRFSWGPLTLYRNTPLINGLFRYANRPLSSIFGVPKVFNFDEWGGRDMKFYNFSMTGIIDQYRHELGIRWYGGLGVIWDGVCKKLNDTCGQCQLIRYPSSNSSTDHVHPKQERQPPQHSQETPLQHTRQTLFNIGRSGKPVGEAAVCHFELSKDLMEESLANYSADGNTIIAADDGADNSFINLLWKAGQLHVNFWTGFAFPPPQIQNDDDTHKNI